MRRRLRLAALLAFLAAVVALIVFSWGCHGHLIRGTYVPNHAADFDFRRPPCSEAPRPVADAGDVVLRYLGVGGLYIEWQGTALMTAPYFSSYGLIRSGLGSVQTDREAVERGLTGIEMERVRAVLVGHTHFDHIADLPTILGQAPLAKVLVNPSGVKMLAAFPELTSRIVDVEPQTRRWIRLQDELGEDLPVRIMPIPSSHADHVDGIHYAEGKVGEPWDSWEGRRLRSMKEGQVFAYLIDLLDADGEVAFRIHHHDAASSAPDGFPSEELVARHPVDLTVLCMPGAWLVKDYPRGIIEAAKTRHVLVGHYEDFFRSREKPLRFVALLRDGRAEQFMKTVKREMSGGSHRPRGPEPCVCGPCGPAWSMPLPGEWLRFRPERQVSRLASP